MSRGKKTIKKIQYVIPVGNAWAVKSSGNIKFTIITDSKKEAVSFAKEIAKRNESDLIVYSKDGSIAVTSSYARKGKIAAKA